MTYYCFANMSNTTGATGWTGTDYYSSVVSMVLVGVSITFYFIFWVMFCGPVFVFCLIYSHCIVCIYYFWLPIWYLQIFAYILLHCELGCPEKCINACGKDIVEWTQHYFSFLTLENIGSITDFSLKHRHPHRNRPSPLSLLICSFTSIRDLK